MREISATDAALRLPELLDAIEDRGQIFTITRSGTAVASLGPSHAAKAPM